MVVDDCVVVDVVFVVASIVVGFVVVVLVVVNASNVSFSNEAVVISGRLEEECANECDVTGSCVEVMTSPSVDTWILSELLVVSKLLAGGEVVKAMSGSVAAA